MTEQQIIEDLIVRVDDLLAKYMSINRPNLQKKLLEIRAQIHKIKKQ